MRLTAHVRTSLKHAHTHTHDESNIPLNAFEHTRRSTSLSRIRVVRNAVRVSADLVCVCVCVLVCACAGRPKGLIKLSLCGGRSVEPKIVHDRVYAHRSRRHSRAFAGRASLRTCVWSQQRSRRALPTTNTHTTATATLAITSTLPNCDIVRAIASSWRGVA